MNQTPRILVRPARNADASAIVGFNRAMALETKDLELIGPTVSAGVGAVLADPGKGFYLMAELDGRPCGALMVTPQWSDRRNGPMWWIQSVYVVPDARGSGVYRASHDTVLSMACNSGLRGIRLYVEKSNAPAHNVYQSMGMRPSGYLMFEQEVTP